MGRAKRARCPGQQEATLLAAAQQVMARPWGDEPRRPATPGTCRRGLTQVCQQLSTLAHLHLQAAQRVLHPRSALLQGAQPLAAQRARRAADGLDRRGLGAGLQRAGRDDAHDQCKERPRAMHLPLAALPGPERNMRGMSSTGLAKPCQTRPHPAAATHLAGCRGQGCILQQPCGALLLCQRGDALSPPLVVAGAVPTGQVVVRQVARLVPRMCRSGRGHGC